MIKFYLLMSGHRRALNLRPRPASYVTALFFMLCIAAEAQYTQNFDTITTAGSGTFNNLPEGWGIYEVGSGGAADGRYVVNNGSSNTGNAYSYGILNGTDRALGSLGSGGNSPTIGAIFFNETDNPITSITISFVIEQWRFGGNSTNRPAGTADIIPFSYSLDANSIANTAPGTWVSVPELNLSSIITSGTASALVGDDAANRRSVSYTITGINLAPGGSILIRWSDSDTPGSDDGLSIDEFSISAGLSPGTLTSGATTTGGGTGGGTGTPTNTSTSTPIFQHQVAIDSGFLHLYGNLHGHSTHSDGRPSTLQPIDDYNYARNAAGMDFLGISEHNHSTAGLQIADYKLGYAQAESVNGQPNIAGLPFITLYGMEWGTISGGGHVLVYGFKDSLINWEPGNYDILVIKGDYITLFDSVRNHAGAFATLAHPNTSDFTGLTGGYKGIADSAVVSVAIESGPAFTTNTSYSDYPSSLAYINYYRNLLRRGYRVAAQMDQDNHEMTFGTANQNRMVVLSKERTREALVNGIRAMRVYASNDYNAAISFKMNDFIMGSSILSVGNLTATVNHTDADGEGISAIQVYGGRVGGTDATLIHTAIDNTSFTTTQGAGETWYYYAVITQADGQKMITAPIWLTRPESAPLPVKLVDFKATLNNGRTLVSWKTSEEINSDYFEVERSANGLSYQSLGRVNANGNPSDYSFTDLSPLGGTSYYRLKMADGDGSSEYSSPVAINQARAAAYTVAPNPASNRITIRAAQGVGKLHVQIIDAAGNRVHNEQFTGQQQLNIDVSRLPAGVYVIRINDEISRLVITK
ncbi:MAG TPA: CehA/McbA family metallohydrolase [Flavisolibacter sp.]|nr:CehA/McbA family metallohydrolase [Flavisolibacter sp.]